MIKRCFLYLDIWNVLEKNPRGGEAGGGGCDRNDDVYLLIAIV